MRNHCPVSVLIVTKNEEKNLARCLHSVQDFQEVIVIDSCSEDRTTEIAKTYNRTVIDFTWNGVYPKKRGWCLAHVPTQYDWIFFLDADEVITKSCQNEMTAILQKENLDEYAGFFIAPNYVFEGEILRHGLHNKKLALLHKKKMEFPVVDDLDIEGMGEIEGHYQPILKSGMTAKIGHIKTPMLHYAYEDKEKWTKRHKKYAVWESGMTKKNAWPEDPLFLRQWMKKIFRSLPFRGFMAFCHSYIFCAGFLDRGKELRFAKTRMNYYSLFKNQ